MDTTLTNVDGTLLRMEKSLEELKDQIAPKGTQKIKGIYTPIPALVKDYTLYPPNNPHGGHSFKSDKDILLTGITFSQSAWQYEDNWDLNIDITGITLFESIYTKEVAEHKKLNKFFPIPAGTSIDIVLHNNSGNSRQVWVDFEYMEL